MVPLRIHINTSYRFSYKFSYRFSYRFSNRVIKKNSLLFRSILRTVNVTITLKSVVNDLSHVLHMIVSIVFGFASNTCLQNEELKSFFCGQDVPSKSSKSSKTSYDVLRSAIFLRFNLYEGECNKVRAM